MRSYKITLTTIIAILTICVGCTKHRSQLLDLINIDDKDQSNVFVVSGLFPAEGSSSDKWRWGMGPASELFVYTQKQGIFQFNINFENDFQGQSIVFVINGKVAKEIYNIPVCKGKDKSMLIVFDAFLDNGKNSITINYSLWNNGVSRLFDDDRNFAIKYREFTIGSKQ